MERFDEVFTLLYPRLYGLVWRVLGDDGETEDTLQDAFAKLATDPVLGRPDGEVAAWLRRVCLNSSFNRLRSRRRLRDHTDRAGRLEAAGAAEPDGPLLSVLRSQEQDEVRRALGGLPARQRDCLLLRHSGYSYAEIATTLQIATGSVGVLLSRAERAFRRAYAQHHSQEPST